MSPSPRGLAQHDVRDRVADGRRQVFGRYSPIALTLDRGANRCRDPSGIDTGDYVAPTLDGLGAFRHIPRRDVGDMQDAAFLLHGAAVGQHARSVALECEEVEEA